LLPIEKDYLSFKLLLINLLIFMFYKFYCSKLAITLLALLFFIPLAYSQTKKLKRPNSRVKISSVDVFVQESFDLYEKVYKYDGYAAKRTPLDDDDIDVLEEALSEITNLSDSAPDIISDLDGAGILKQSKATLQINKAKKALKYSIKTAKELLLGERNNDEDENNKTDDSRDDEESENKESSSNDSSSNENDEQEDSPNPLEIYSKFDFVPGDKMLFFDDFSRDFVGDFPSKWNTNGSGELVKINNDSNKWLRLVSGRSTAYIPDINNLPDVFTLEFDMLTKNLNSKTSSQSYFQILISDNNMFDTGTNFAMVEIPLCQFIDRGIIVENKINGKREIRNEILVDIREQVTKRNHISVAINMQRFRLWINETKYVDVPRLLPKNVEMKSIKLHLRGLDLNTENLYVSNFKVAEGGIDLRRQLISEGNISTNGILFDSGSAHIKPQSYGIIRQISQVLQQEETMRLKIVGHTDSDGTDDENLKLSKSRAEAVKQALINVYKIKGIRLISEGKGESDSVAENTTAEGKAKNRRVEFIKQ
jgi:outer membrane protein OmpA-like peptidoglycan-associated protein